MQDQTEHRADIAALRDEVRQLSASVASLSAMITGMAQAWEASKGVLVFAKWVAAFGASVAVIWAALTGHRQ